ncbi:MAG: GAF domain-containing protein [Leptospiraceae bacterium]|nr:GAF domain-containing protein [Leptospiraceae bacterium]MCP5496220.1 GAF domain-containing protein [Leptospiraceae bacterium]
MKQEKKVEKLSLLMDVAKSIMAEMDTISLMTVIVGTVTKVMDADRSSLFLIDKETGELWSLVAQGMSQSVIRLPMGKGIVGYVAQTGITTNIPDAYEDDRFNKSFDLKTGYRTKSILCMAMKNQHSEILGAIQVLNKLDGTEFSEDDEDLLAAFSSLAGISLENVRAYEELEKEKNSLEIKVQERTKDLAEAKKQSDDLLLNILPSATAEELKTNGKATPRDYEVVSVLFTDFKGFTKKAEKLSPNALIDELDRCFYYFDGLMDKFHLEKIKTIGDAYMCAGGIPKANKTNPFDAVLAGLEIQGFILQMQEEKKQKQELYWDVRLGIHTGPVVAGVVGMKKFAYDIWGDTVNTASRMESSGEVGKVNISGATYNFIKDFFDCTYRGKIPAKNKGEIDMYFVDRIKPEYSKDDLGKEPNELFLQKLKEMK